MITLERTPYQQIEDLAAQTYGPGVYVEVFVDSLNKRRGTVYDAHLFDKDGDLLDAAYNGPNEAAALEELRLLVEQEIKDIPDTLTRAIWNQLRELMDDCEDGYPGTLYHYARNIAELVRRESK